MLDNTLCIIEHFGNADAVPQPPERCLSRKAGIMRYCPKPSPEGLRPLTGTNGSAAPHQSAVGAADSFPRRGSHATNKQQSRAVFTLLGYSYAFLASPSGKTTNKPPSRTHLAAAGCFSAKVFQSCMTALPVSCCAGGFPAAR